jgi:hypothetical protein
MHLPRRPAILAALLVVGGACGTPPPAPTGDPSASPPTVATPDAADQVPAMVVRADLDDGVRWWVTSPGAPLARRPLAVPAGDVQLGPAAVDGSLLLTVGTTAATARLSGDELATIRVVDLGAQGLGVSIPGCLSEAGTIAVADADTLGISVLPPDGGAVPVEVPLSLGECAWLENGSLVLSAEGDRLFAWDAGTGNELPLSATGRHPSSGGGLVSVVDRSGPRPVVVVRATNPVQEDPDPLGPERFRILTGPDELIANAQLSPDGGWLALTLDAGPEGATSRRVRFYRVTVAGPEANGEIPLGEREQVTLLPAGTGGR